MESPKRLKHQPIISVNDYSRIDALYANRTDAEALSIGKAQWDQSQISLKVWRHTSEKWSRQSEELPIHRNLDLSILFLAALTANIHENYPNSFLGETIDRIENVADIKEFYNKHKHFFQPRLKELKRLLNKIEL